MAFLKGDLLTKLRTLMKGGVVDKPVWLDAITKVPPEPKVLRAKKPPNIVLPEDPLVESYYARHPEAKEVPFTLQGFDPPVARRFALRQLQLMAEGVPRRKARDVVEAEFRRVAEAEAEAREEERRRALKEGGGRVLAGEAGSAVEAAQAEEQEHIAASLEYLAQRGEEEGRR